MLFSRVRIKDDRGKLVDVFNASSPSAYKDAINQDPALADLVARLAASNTPGFNQKLTLNNLGLFSSGLLIVPCMFLVRYLLPGTPLVVQYIIIGCVVIAWSQFFLFRIRRESSLITVSTLLSESRCGSCAYNISQTLEQDDHCIQCPECGSAWKSSRVLPASRTPSPQSGITAADRNTVTGSFRWAWNRLPTIIDGEQRALAIINPSLKPPPETMPPELVSQAYKRIRKRTRRTRLFLVGVMLFFCAVTLTPVGLLGPTSFLNLMATVFQRQGPFVSGMIALIVVWTIIFMSMSMFRIWTCRTQVTAEQVTQALLELNLCPACGSLLPTSTPSNDSISSPTPTPTQSQTTHPTHSSTTPTASPQVPTPTRCTHCAAAWAIPGSAKTS